MVKLTDTQLIVLSKAARREDGAAGVPDGIVDIALSRRADLILAYSLGAAGITIISARRGLLPGYRPRRTTITRPLAGACAGSRRHCVLRVA